jgi:molybdenum cofactor synthesis domain-containing protein
MTETSPTAAVLIIGNEILSGRTQDTNLAHIAKKLGSIGIRIAEARVVPDIEAEIVAAVNALRARYTYVFTTGGIGPTHDDITTDCIAKAFGVAVIEHPEARARLVAHYTKTPLTPARLRMARIPENASLIDNGVSAAPGFCIGNVYVMAGIPNVMQAMLETILPTLTHGPAYSSKSISGFVAESLIAEGLGVVAERYPQLDIGSYPWKKDGRWGTALVARGTDQAAIDAASGEILALVKQHDPMPEIEVSPKA